MASGQLRTVLRHIHRVASPRPDGEATDAELLERFAARQDESAFEALVRRHGALVLGVCRRVLGNRHDAEDAFQATFLILFRKAASIRKGNALGGWLHEVASRVSLRARASAASRRRHEQRVPDMPQKDFLATVVWRDLQPVLDEEVQRLPQTCREAFVLCHLEGKTYEEAAGQLGCRPGTISRRLTRARELLRGRLARRGLVLPTGLLAAALSEMAAPAAVPAKLVTATVKAALRAAGAAAGAVPARVAALVEGGLQSMAASKVKMALGVFLVASVCWAAAALAHPVLADRGDAPGRSEKPRAKAAEARPQPAAEDAGAGGQAGPVVKDTVTASGTVVDAAGKPVAGARVAVIGRTKRATRARGLWPEPRAVAEGTTDAEGRFRLAARGASRAGFWELHLLARAHGHGLGHARLETAKGEVRLQLPAERVVRGRLVDLQGVAADGVTVAVNRLQGKVPTGQYWFNLEGLPADAAFWPAPTATDAGGRFTVRGLPPGVDIQLEVRGERFAADYLDAKRDADEVNLALAPAKVFEGTVTYGDTKKPVPNARLRIYSQKQRYGPEPIRSITVRTDDRGRYRAAPHVGRAFTILAYPPDGAPYLAVNREIDWTQADALKQEVNLALRRGVVVRGTVTEAPGGKPVGGATVEFEPRFSNNPFFSREILPLIGGRVGTPVTGADGKFETVVLPGPGHLLVNGPTPDYIHAEIVTRKLLGEGVMPNRRHYPDGLVALDLKPDTGPHDVKVTLRRGTTLRGRVVGPDGKAVSQGLLFCRSYIPQGYTLNPVNTLLVKDGKFELPGWDAANPAPLYVYDAKNQLGGVVDLAGKEVGGDGPTVRLRPCGSARVRLVDEKGQPLQNLRIDLEIPISSGASFFDIAAQQRYELTADAAAMGNLDPQRHWDLRTNDAGRVVLPALIPGARYWIIVTRPSGGMFRLDTEFTVESGREVDLKDVTVKLRF
jgi:RNA polymerase sigma factor (sigma-70 family)